jgi:hypothetical protein
MRTYLRARRAPYPLEYTIDREDKPQKLRDMKKLLKLIIDAKYSCGYNAYNRFAPM